MLIPHASSSIRASCHCLSLAVLVSALIGSSLMFSGPLRGPPPPATRRQALGGKGLQVTSFTVVALLHATGEARAATADARMRQREPGPPRGITRGVEVRPFPLHPLPVRPHVL